MVLTWTVDFVLMRQDHAASLEHNVKTHSRIDRPYPLPPPER